MNKDKLMALSHVDSFLVFDVSRFSEVFDILGIDRFDKGFTSLYGDIQDIRCSDGQFFQLKFNNINIIFCKGGLQDTVQKLRGEINQAREDGRQEVLELLKHKGFEKSKLGGERK